jgi:D-threo-aldose 1-dehydrogenase
MDRLVAQEWVGWLQTEVAVGRIRSFGIAGEGDRIGPFLAAASPLAAVIQTSDSLIDWEADAILKYGRALQITYGYVSSAVRCGGSVDAASILAQALKRNSTGSIIISTRRPERLALYGSLVPEAMQ